MDPQPGQLRQRRAAIALMIALVTGMVAGATGWLAGNWNIEEVLTSPRLQYRFVIVGPDGKPVPGARLSVENERRQRAYGVIEELDIAEYLVADENGVVVCHRLPYRVVSQLTMYDRVRANVEGVPETSRPTPANRVRVRADGFRPTRRTELFLAWGNHGGQNEVGTTRHVASDGFSGEIPVREVILKLKK